MKQTLKNTTAITAVIFLLIFLALGIYQYFNFLLLIFAGILLGLVLKGCSSLTANKLNCPYWVGLVSAGLVFFTLPVLLAIGFGPAFLEGIAQWEQTLPKAVDKIDAYANSQPIFASYWERLSSSGSAILPQIFSRLAGIFSSAVGLLTALLFVIVSGFFLASQPELYHQGAIKLLPPPLRSEARQLMEESAHILRWWLLGRVFSVLVVGVLTWLGLTALNMPSALMLATVAAICSFVPNIGPIVAAIPALLIAFTHSSEMSIGVAILYIAVQTVESYFITPVIQQKNLLIPPALLLAFQLLLGLLAGILGLLLATPLLVLLIITVKRLYLEKTLGETVALR